jgi:hypothetical protein
VSFTLDRLGSFQVKSQHLEDHRDLDSGPAQAEVSGLIAMAECVDITQ